MKKVLVAVMAVLTAGSAAMAGGDKVATAFVDTSSVDGGSNGFTNGVSAGTAKQGGCSIQIAMKGLNTTTIPDGSLVICVGSADVRAAALGPNPAGNSVVWTVPAKAGKIAIKNTVAVLDVGGNHCGSAKTISSNSDTACFLPDGGYNPQTACSGAGGLWIPSPVGTVNLKGLCQGFTNGFRIPNPSTGKIASTGSTILLGAK